MMSSSSVKRKTEEDLMDSVKKVNQSDSNETKDSNKDKMASTSLDDRQGEDGADMSVPPGIRLFFPTSQMTYNLLTINFPSA